MKDHPLFFCLIVVLFLVLLLKRPSRHLLSEHFFPKTPYMVTGSFNLGSNRSSNHIFKHIPFPKDFSDKISGYPFIFTNVVRSTRYPHYWKWMDNFTTTVNGITKDQTTGKFTGFNVLIQRTDTLATPGWGQHPTLIWGAMEVLDDKDQPKPSYRIFGN